MAMQKVSIPIFPHNRIYLQEGADGGERVAEMGHDRHIQHGTGNHLFTGRGAYIEWAEHIMPQDIILGAMIRIHYYQTVNDGKWAHPKNNEAMILLSQARNEVMLDPMGPPIFDYGKNIVKDTMTLRKIKDGGTVSCEWANYVDTDNNPEGGVFDIWVNISNPPDNPVRVKWQAGPIKVNQQSGAFIEDLLIAAVIRLTQFNPQELYKDVPSANCNRAAARCLEAIAALQERRAEREAAGTWGTNEV